MRGFSTIAWLVMASLGTTELGGSIHPGMNDPYFWFNQFGLFATFINSSSTELSPGIRLLCAFGPFRWFYASEIPSRCTINSVDQHLSRRSTLSCKSCRVPCVISTRALRSKITASFLWALKMEISRMMSSM